MTTRVLLNVSDREGFVRLLESYKLPCTVTVKKGKDRSIEQNKLQRLWMNEIAEQLKDDSPEGYRAYCKLHFGVPIMREDDDFCEAYDKHIRALPYETKIAFMRVPLDFPVTRLMKTGQMTRYLDEVFAEFDGRGVRLTLPQDRKAA